MYSTVDLRHYNVQCTVLLKKVSLRETFRLGTLSNAASSSWAAWHLFWGDGRNRPKEALVGGFAWRAVL
jgi:hypothetical protein